MRIMLWVYVSGGHHQGFGSFLCPFGDHTSVCQYPVPHSAGEMCCFDSPMSALAILLLGLPKWKQSACIPSWMGALRANICFIVLAFCHCYSQGSRWQVLYGPESLSVDISDMEAAPSQPRVILYISKK